MRISENPTIYARDFGSMNIDLVELTRGTRAR